MIQDNIIENPYINGYCKKCRKHYLLDGDESRCHDMWVGLSNAMCVQVVECNKYEKRVSLEGE